MGDDDNRDGNNGQADGGYRSTTAERGSPAKDDAVVAISATDFKFTPSQPSVKADKVTFELTNDGKAPHALEVESPSGEAETKTIDAGASSRVRVELSRPGSYRMYCPVGNHEQMGMVGEVRVTG